MKITSQGLIVAKLGTLERLQAETVAELAALLPRSWTALSREDCEIAQRRHTGENQNH